MSSIKKKFSGACMKGWTAFVILMICGFVFFGNTIANDYNLDDGYYTNGHPVTTKGLAGIPELLRQPTLFGPRGEGFDYRPVAAISFAMQNEFFGDSAAAGHFINLVLYILTALVIFSMLRRWFKGENNNVTAFWIALLFLVHPLHTEVVASIKSRDEILALLFSLGSMHFASRFVHTRNLFHLVPVFVFFCLALFSKYTIAPFIIIIPLSLYYFHRYPLGRSVYAALALLAFAGVCHVVKTAVLPDSDHIFSITENGLAHPDVTTGERMGTSFYVMGRYLLLHLVPVNLVFYYGYSYVPIVGISDFAAIMSALTHVALVIYCIINFKRKDPVVFGCAVYLVFMVIYSNLVELSPGMIAERFTYVSSLGFIMVVVCLFRKYAARLFPSQKYLPGLALAAVVLLFGLQSLSRNANWKDKETLYGHDIAVAPNSAMVNYLYGDLKLSQAVMARQSAASSPVIHQVMSETASSIREAEGYFKRALSINPKDSLADASLVTCALQLGDLKMAAERARQTIVKYPAYWDMYFLLGTIYMQERDPKAAINQFRTVIANDPPFMAAYEQLHRALLTTGDTVTAVQTLRLAMRRYPQSPVAYAEMANFYISEGRMDSAIFFAEKAARLPPLNRGLLQYLVTHFGKTGDQIKTNEYNQLLQKLD